LLDLSRVYRLIDLSEDEFTKGNLRNALLSIKKAISLNPNIDEAYIDLALTCLKLNRRKEAENAFRDALRLNPKLRRVITQLPNIGLMERNEPLFETLQLT
jgi:Flp pilus assembly protein TadD